MILTCFLYFGLGLFFAAAYNAYNAKLDAQFPTLREWLRDRIYYQGFADVAVPALGVAICWPIYLVALAASEGWKG